MNENYEVEGRVRRLRQRREYRPITPEIDRHRDLESFDIEFSPEGLVQELTAYNYLGELDCREVCSYDVEQRLTGTLKYDSRGNLAAVMSYEYSDGGGRAEWSERSIAGNLLASGVEEYRGKDLISIARFRANGLLFLQKKFEYAEERLAKSVSVYYRVEGGVGERSISTYDSNGRLAETYGLTPDGDALGDGLYRYEYDAEGRKSRVLSFNDFSESDIPNHISEFIYRCDENGNWIERRELSAFESDDCWNERVTLREILYYVRSRPSARI
ncbi:MAG TPA: hypothetical protein VOA88_03850 [Candidatus Dormibacteraeota bacterium]|nr:hypothetical protein [Candidatus Dormibacteraeota bacterium]